MYRTLFTPITVQEKQFKLGQERIYVRISHSDTTDYFSFPHFCSFFLRMQVELLLKNVIHQILQSNLKKKKRERKDSPIFLQLAISNLLNIHHAIPLCINLFYQEKINSFSLYMAFSSQFIYYIHHAIPLRIHFVFYQKKKIYNFSLYMAFSRPFIH